jgi:flagellar hook assembly protein FlgD
MGLPKTYGLGQAYPNPSTGHAVIGYQLPRPDRVELRVYNISGQLVRTLVDGNLPAGRHQARWDGRDQSGKTAASGVYMYRLVTPNYSQTGKLSLVR